MHYMVSWTLWSQHFGEIIRVLFQLCRLQGWKLTETHLPKASETLAETGEFISTTEIFTLSSALGVMWDAWLLYILAWLWFLSRLFLFRFLWGAKLCIYLFFSLMENVQQASPLNLPLEWQEKGSRPNRNRTWRLLSRFHRINQRLHFHLNVLTLKGTLIPPAIAQLQARASWEEELGGGGEYLTPRIQT